MKTFYALVIALWLVAGLGLHAYISRMVQEPAAVEAKRDLYLRQFENDDSVAPQIRSAHWHANTIKAASYAAWLAIGGLLAIPAIASLFPKREKAFDV